MTKLCVNCKHSRWWFMRYCNHPNQGVDPVTGDLHTSFCFRQRGELGACRPEGFFYEPSLWYKIKMKVFFWRNEE